MELDALCKAVGASGRRDREIVEAFVEGCAVPPGEVDPNLLRALCAHPDEQRAGLVLREARIEGDVDLARMNVDFPLRFERCEMGLVRLDDARLVALDLVGGSCTGIEARRLSVQHGVSLGKGFSAGGRIWLPDAELGGELDCRGGTFAQTEDTGETPLALNFAGARIGGRVVLSEPDGLRFKATGPVSGHGARVGGGFVARHAVLQGTPDRPALDLRAADFGGEGDLEKAQIEGGLTLRRARFSSSVRLEGAHLKGRQNDRREPVSIIDLAGVRINGDLNLKSVEVGAVSEIDLRRVNAAGSLRLKGVSRGKNSGIGALVDLGQARVAYLDDDVENWKQFRSLKLQGFVYDGVVPPHQALEEPEPGENSAAGDATLPEVRESLLPGTVPAGGWARFCDMLGVGLSAARHPNEPWEHWKDLRRRRRRRREWLQMQAKGFWSPQPYTQAARALSLAGEQRAARNIAIYRERDRRWRGHMNPAAWLASWPLGGFVGFGYRPVLTLYWAVTVVAAGCWLLPDTEAGYSFKRRDPEPPPFNGLAYSVDAFLPIDLRQVTIYTPKDTWPNVVLWLETGFGWLLAALLLAGVTGVLRRD